MLHWLVYFIVFSVVFWKLGTINIGFFSLNQALILFIYFIIFVKIMLRRQQLFVPSLLDIALFLFGFYLFFSNFLINDDPSWGIRIGANYLRSMAFYLLVVFVIDTRKKISGLLITFIVASFAMVLSGNLYIVVKEGLRYSTHGGRGAFAGLAGSYINYALYSLMSIPLTFYFFNNASQLYKRWIYLVSLIILSMGVIFSGSRGGVVAFIFMVFLVMVFELRKTVFAGLQIKKFMFFPVLATIILSLFLYRGGADLLFSLLSVFSEETRDVSLALRLSINKESLRLFLENPIFGVGVDSIRVHYSIVPHNQWLQIAAELGLVGLLVSFVAVFFIFRTLFKAYKISLRLEDYIFEGFIKGIAISVLSIFFWGFYENMGLLVGTKVLFLLLGACRSIEIALGRLYARQVG